MELGAINPNTFQDDDYSWAASAIRTPRCAGRLDHLLECVDIMDATGSRG